MDYDDLILLTRDLLGREGVAPWVLFKLDGGPRPRADRRGAGHQPGPVGGGRRADGGVLRRRGRACGPAHRLRRGRPQTVDLQLPARRPGRLRGPSAPASPSGRPAGRPGTRSTWTSPSARPSRCWRWSMPSSPTRRAAGVVRPDEPPVRHVSYKRGQAGLVELWPAIGPEEGEDAPEAWTAPVDQRARRARPTGWPRRSRARSRAGSTAASGCRPATGRSPPATS